MIDTSWGSLRIALVMVMGVVWFYLLNQHLRDTDEDKWTTSPFFCLPLQAFLPLWVLFI